MSKKYMMFPSITYAMKAKNILRSQGIYADMVKTSQFSTQKGCGYSLVFNRNFDKALAVLQKNGISITDIATS
ncbi:MAG: DUF3343 domain-containing protein [Clostridia bacterium]|nr:DUF3343 domain-containing protein [Clostridia bacterium]